MKIECKYCGKEFEAIDERQLRFYLRGHIVGKHPHRVNFDDERLNEKKT
jgi:hypothetical protein